MTRYVLPGALTVDLFVAALDEYSQTLPGQTVFVLDNASEHRAPATPLGPRGAYPYCPELNLIEILWHHYKYY